VRPGTSDRHDGENLRGEIERVRAAVARGRVAAPARRRRWCTVAWLTWRGTDRQQWRAAFRQAASGAAAVGFGQACPDRGFNASRRTWPGGVASAHAMDRAAPLGQSTRGMWQVSR
jgi:hypothetical protein